MSMTWENRGPEARGLNEKGAAPFSVGIENGIGF
jgi:hypothetical protein